MSTTEASTEGRMPARPDARRRVAVGVDGSDESRAAIAYALAAAARRGVGLDVVGVYSLQMYYVGGGALAVPDVAAIRDGFEQLVTRTVEEVRADPRVAAVPGVAEVDVRVLVATGPAAQVLVDHGTDVGLLVVGSRGRGAVRSALLGSVALHCATHASCPVVVVHPGSEEHPARRVVVGVDGSDTARAALVAGLDEAARTGADVEAVAAYLVEDFWTDLGPMAGPPEEAIRADLRAGAERTVAEVTAERAEAGLLVPPVVVSVVHGGASDVLVERSRDAELLVVGSRSHGGVRGLLLGSVALWCAVHAAGPVMVVRPTATESGGSPEPAPAPDRR